MPLSRISNSLGYDLSDDELNRVFVRFKELADVKKEIFDEDLETILYEEVLRIEEEFKLVYLNVVRRQCCHPYCDHAVGDRF